MRQIIKKAIREVLNEQNEVLLAPNGNESNLPKSLYEYVRTDDFKSWFGDWENNPNNSSKIVDENGEPMLVFHGTEKEFQDFNKEDLRFNYFYFTVDENYAKHFGKVKGCFLNVRKLKDMKKAGVAPITSNQLFKFLGFKDSTYEFFYKKRKFWDFFRLSDEIYRVLKWNNYDCVNFFEDFDEDGATDKTEVFAVFNSNQIKCIGKNKTY